MTRSPQVGLCAVPVACGSASRPAPVASAARRSKVLLVERIAHRRPVCRKRLAACRCRSAGRRQPASTSQTSSAYGADQVPGAGIALAGQHLGEEAPRPEHRIARACRAGSATQMARSSAGIEGGDQPVDQRRRRRPACRPAGSAAPSQSSGSALRPRLRDVLKPFEKSGLSAKMDRQARQRRRDLVALSLPVTTMTGSRGAAERRLDRVAHQRLAADPLPAACCEPIREDRPAASTMAPIRGSCGASTAARRAAAAGSGSRLSSPPTPMAAISARPTGKPASDPPQHEVEAVQLGRARAAGQADHGPRRSASPVSSRLPGSTGMPKASMVPPAGFDRGRDHVAAVGDGAGAEDQDGIGARLRPRAMAAASAPVSCATRRSKTIVEPSGVQPVVQRAAVLVQQRRLGAGQGGRDQRRAARHERRDADERRRRAAAAPPPRPRRAARRRG